jgi:hypothetical protein
MLDDARYRAILPATLRSTPVTIIGCGNIGAAFARQLALCGFESLILFDHDTVEPVNLGTQGWSVEDIGLPKVEALAASLRRMRPSLSITTHHCRWSRRYLSSLTPIVASCVDSRDTDRFILDTIWATSPPSPFLYLSPRVRAIDYVLRTVFCPATYATFQSAFFPDSSVPPEANQCGIPTTLYGGTAAACLMLEAMRRYHAAEPVITYAQCSFLMPPSTWLFEELDPTQGAAVAAPTPALDDLPF